MRALLIIAVPVLAVLAQDAWGQSACDLAAADAQSAGPRCARAWFDANLRLNEIQTVGTADSTKQLPNAQMLALVRMSSSKDAQALDFAQPPLAAQFSANARSLEFDVAYDPKGGLFKYPAGAAMSDELLGDDYVGVMSQPGFKVIHVLDVDYHSSCLTFIACLQNVADWSRSHADHVPIVILIHSNDQRTPMPGATRPIPFDAAAFDALDKEILSVFKPEELLTPDAMQGGYASLRAAAVAQAWPKLGLVRGKVIFVLDDSAEKVSLYQGARRGLEGRVMFVAADEASPLAAFVTIEDPVKNAARIIADVKAGLMVHTRADADTKEARQGNTLRRDSAFASGAQIVSTDFIFADKAIGAYEARLSSNHRADCDVQLSPQRCSGLGVERGNDPAIAVATDKER